MTLLVLVRRDAPRVAAALRRLQQAPLAVVGLYDPLPPHELRLVERSLLGRSERARPHEAEVEAAGRDAARAAADDLAALAAGAGFDVRSVEVTHPGPRELDALLERERPELVLVERGDRPLPPPLRHLADRGELPLLIV